MHVLPSSHFVIVSEVLDFVRTAKGYRVSVAVTIKRTAPGKRVAPVAVAWSPVPSDDRWEVDEGPGVTFVTDEAALLFEVGGMLADEELDWYRSAANMRFTVLRGTEKDEQTLRHTWSVANPTIYVPLRQPMPSAPIPVTTITVAGGHHTLITKPFGRVAVKGSTGSTSITFPRQQRPVHDLVERDTATAKDEKDCIVQ